MQSNSIHVNMHQNLVEHADGVSKRDLFLALPYFFSTSGTSTTTDKTFSGDKMDKELNIITTKNNLRPFSLYRFLPADVLFFSLCISSYDGLRKFGEPAS